MVQRYEQTRKLQWYKRGAAYLSSDEAYEKLMNDGKIFVNSGTMYGRKAGQGFLRLNIACPRKTLMQGLIRIARVLSQYVEDEDTGCPM